ncbi:MAG: hypothetical protein JSW64_13040 [Candidatus Zixiibacteriota bacterium]|nr:MAG: hypothetical protein JSW64_13040 [candidate division Zixibacteria bacterium]
MKRVFKIILICSVSLVGLFFLALISLRIYFSDSRIKEFATDAIKENTGGDAVIGSLDISGFLKIDLEGLELRNEINDSVWLRIAGVRADIEPLKLIYGDLHVSDMIIKDLRLNYVHIPDFQRAPAEGEAPSAAMDLPLDLVMERFELGNFVASGPEAKLGFDLIISQLSFQSPDDFSAAYSLNTDKGLIHYYSEDLSLNGTCDVTAAGVISSSENTAQDMKVSLSDIRLVMEESLLVDNLDVTLKTMSKFDENLIVVDDLTFNLDDKEILGFTGQIKLKEKPELALRAREKSWDITGLNPLLKDLNLPLILAGIISIEDLSISGSPDYTSYDFVMGLKDVGIDYDKMIYLGGLSGSIYSSGDPELIVFGSSLTADSISGRSDSLHLFSVYTISSAVEAEISSSDIYFNINTGITDFFGGKFDIFAFTESSKIDGDLRVQNLNLSKAVSNILAGEGVDLGGLFGMTLKVSGRTDSLQSNLTASLENLKVSLENDSLFIPRQDFNFSASTIIGKESINSRFAYDVHESVSGNGEFLYPLKPTALDSIIMSYRMNLDNSVLPSYLPAAALEALGAVELSGGSVLDGRFSSPVDTFKFTGSSKLTIEPTDILIDDFQSVLYSLISVSELEVTDRGISLFSNSGIEELFNENYSEFDFSGITIEGEIVSLADTTWRITNMNAKIPSLKSRLDLMGDFGFAGEAPFSNLTLYFAFDSDEPVEIGNQLYVKGELKAEIRTASIDTLLEFSGTADFNNIEIESPGVFRCADINGDIPFSGKLNLQDSIFVVERDVTEISGSGYQRARLANMLAREYGRLKIGRIEADPFYLFDINIDAGFRDGICDIPYLTGELLGGNFYGLLRADLSNVNFMREIPDYRAVSYKLDLELSNLDFNQLTYGMGPFKERADFGADAHFQGSGLIIPEEDYIISGSLHITKMGPGVALRVLDVLDPENSNPSIMQTRELLDRKLLGFIDMSYKPKNFSFELKHGSLYPRLFMDQPFFADVLPLVRVPMPVEYGRIPVKSLLSNLKEESW